MFASGVGKAVAALAVLVSGVGLLVACGRVPGSPVALKSDLVSGVVVGDLLHGITAEGKLATIDLKKGRLKEIALPARKLGRFIDVANGKACVASADRLHVIDLGTGKELGEVPLTGPVFGVGFAGGKRVFIRTGSAIVFVDLACYTDTSGKIELGDNKSPRPGEVVCYKAGTKLYTTTRDSRLLVIDLEKGKVVEEIKLPHLSVGAIHVTQDKATVVGLRLGYGVWTNSVGQIDLKTKKFTPLKMPRELRQSSAVGAADGSLFLTDGTDNYQYDRAGKLVGPLAEKEAGRLIAVWQGKALLSKAKALKMLPLTRSTARAR